MNRRSIWCALAAFGAATLALLAPPSAAQENSGEWQRLSPRQIRVASTKVLSEQVLRVSSIADLQRAASAGDALAMHFLGYAYKTGKGGLQKDDARSYELSKQSCERGSQRGCLGLAYNLIQGRGVAKDLDRGLDLFAQTCDGGIPLACDRLAAIHVQGAGGAPKDRALAQRYYLKGCDGGVGDSCRWAAYGYLKGQGAGVDRLEARRLYLRGCTLDSEWSCFNAAREIERDSDRNDPKAFEVIATNYERGCELGNGASCYNRGIIENEGKFGRATSTRAAVPWMEEACKLGFNDACYNLGSWLIDGRAGRKDGKRAIALLGPLCLRDKNPDIQACNNAGTAAYRGSGMAAPDYESARQFYTRACYEGALTASCRTLSDMYRDRQITAREQGEAQWLDAQLCFKAEEQDYCRSGTRQYLVLLQAAQDNYSDAAVVAGDLCREGDLLGCRTETLLKACAKARTGSKTMEACRRAF
jgi:TPR repeat protein